MENETQIKLLIGYDGNIPLTKSYGLPNVVKPEHLKRLFDISNESLKRLAGDNLSFSQQATGPVSRTGFGCSCPQTQSCSRTCLQARSCSARIRWTSELKKELYDKYMSGKTYKSLGKEYGKSSFTIKSVVREYREVNDLLGRPITHARKYSESLIKQALKAYETTTAEKVSKQFGIPELTLRTYIYNSRKSGQKINKQFASSNF